MSENITIELFAEADADGHYFGSVKYDDNLIVENAPTLEEFKINMKTQLKMWHQLDPERINFIVKYPR